MSDVSSAAPTFAPALDPDANELIEDSRARGQHRLGSRSMWSAIAFGAGFVGAATALAVLLPTHRSPSPLVAALLVVAYALTSRVKFEVGTGFALPTQLVLVPMLFVLPLGWVPLAVAAGLLAGRSIEYATGRTPLDHALLVLPNSWHTIGPVLVLAAAGEAAPRLDRWPVYLAALVAQFGTDFCVSGGREFLATGVSLVTLLPYMG